MNIQKYDIILLEDLLGISFPEIYQKALLEQNENLKTTAFPLSLELNSVWGANEFLRGARPDLPPQYIVLEFEHDIALCIDTGGNHENDDFPVVAIDLNNKATPQHAYDSFTSFLEREQSSSIPASGYDDKWFQAGLEHLDRHMRSLTYEYDHKKGGQLPRSHTWRPYRFCVQDVILGVTVIRHDKMYNRLEVDVFLTAWIDEYEQRSGCLALTLIILSDAYKSGGSMEIKFTKNIEGGRVPEELVKLAESKGFFLNHDNVDKGGISPNEAKQLYMALTGFNNKTISKISALEKQGKLSSASICYAVHHGVWSKEELEVILFLSTAPETILTGSYPVELWHLYLHDLQIGRTALLGSYLERQLCTRVHPHQSTTPNIDLEELTELEDDEREIKVEFRPCFCGKKIIIGDEEEAIQIPWIEHKIDNIMLGKGTNLLVLLRARDAEDLRQNFQRDLEKANTLKKENPEDLVCIMVPADFNRLADTERLNFAAIANKNSTSIIICPEFVIQLDQTISKRFESVKVMRS